MKETISNQEDVVEYDFSGGIRGSQQQKYFLNIAGEFYVAAELNRRGIYASVTYGAAKNADVLAFDRQSRQTAVIEVKTTASPNKKWLTGGQSIDKDSVHPQLFWVLVLLPGEGNTESSPRYFVFTSKELVEKVAETHRVYSQQYHSRPGVPFQDSKGVYSLTLDDAEAMQAEQQWEKITEWFARK